LNDKPITDLSDRAVRLARIIDRLPPGHLTIRIEKELEYWDVRVEQNLHVQSWKIVRKDD
jgi:hypothetical protein